MSGTIYCVNIHTVTQLAHLTESFYNSVAASFDQTRSQSWAGWEQLLLELKQKVQSLNVLDIGCGNGRFASFLEEKLSSAVVYYTGTDLNEQLLELARSKHYSFATQFEHRNLIQELIDENLAVPATTNLVTAFGVLHHIPSQQLRRTFFAQLAQKLPPQAVLVVTAWQFATTERYANKLLPAPPQIDTTDLEDNDFFLGWKDTTAVRYCHHTSTEELHTLYDATEWHVKNIFTADGKSQDLNVYLVLQRRAQ